MNTENNKIIAEFMGLSYCKKYQFEGWYTNHEHNYRICDFNSLKYHSDWNWLMDVIIKISSILTEDGEDTFYPRTFGMLTDDGKTMFRFNRQSLFKANTLIEAAHKACVDFIKWNNPQNKK